MTPQARYKKKIVTLRVDFYIKDRDLIAYAKSINFAQFVKEKLKEAIREEKQNG